VEALDELFEDVVRSGEAAERDEEERDELLICEAGSVSRARSTTSAPQRDRERERRTIAGDGREEKLVDEVVALEEEVERLRLGRPARERESSSARARSLTRPR